MPSTALPLAAGFVFQFTWLCLYRAIMTKFPLDLVAVLLALFPWVGFASGLLPQQTGKQNRSRLLWGSAAVLCACLAIGNGTNLHFLVSRIYYPYPPPAGFWLRVALYAAIELSAGTLYYSWAGRLRQRFEGRSVTARTLAVLTLGAALAFPIAHVVCLTIGPYGAAILGASIMATAQAFRPAGILAGVLLASSCLTLTRLLPEQLFTWRAVDYEKKESGWTPYYRLGFVTFKEDACLGGVFNQLMIWYTCKRYEDMPIESRMTTEAFAEGKRRILSMGRSDAMTVMGALHGNPDVEKIVVVEIDPVAVDRARGRYASYHQDLFRDPRVRLIASDWRHFLEEDTGRYDLIYLDGLGIRLYTEPMTLIPQENFLFSREAFDVMVNRRLSPNGVIVANWGSTRKEEAFDIVASLPPGVHRRAFWGTISNYPFAGLGLFFTAASRDASELERISRRLTGSGSLKEISVPDDLSRIAFSDDRPFLQRGLQPMILVPATPFLLALFGAFWVVLRRRRKTEQSLASFPSTFLSMLMPGILMGIAECLAVSTAARQYPTGPATGWTLAGALFLAGMAGAHLLPRLRGSTKEPPSPSKGEGAGGGGRFPSGIFPVGLAAAGLALVLLAKPYAAVAAGVLLVAYGARRVFVLRNSEAHGAISLLPLAVERSGHAMGLFLFQWLSYLVGYNLCALLAILSMLPIVLARRYEPGQRP